MNYFNLYMGDYQRDTADLSVAQHGAYFLLLLHYYSQEQPITADRPTLYRICRAVYPEEMFAVDFVLDRFFQERNGKMTNARCDEEIRKAKRMIEASRANGARGGRPRKENPEKTQQDTQQVPQQGTEQQTQQGTQRITQPGLGIGIGLGVGVQEHSTKRTVSIGGSHD